MNRDVPSNFGIPDSQNPSERFKVAQPELAARLKAMKENTRQQAKILATETAPKPMTPEQPRPAQEFRAKPYDPNDPRTKIGQRVLPPEPDLE